MLVSEASPALHRLLRELEQEKAQLETLAPSRPATAQILPHPTLLQRFRTKLDQLTGALSDDSIRREAAAMMSELIHSVTIYPGERAEAEVSASLTDLIAFAANENDVQWTVRKECSVMVVAGARTGRCATTAVVEI